MPPKDYLMMPSDIFLWAAVASVRSLRSVVVGALGGGLPLPMAELR